MTQDGENRPGRLWGAWPHRHLDAWNQAMDLVVEIHNAVSSFPAPEQYALANQMRRCSVSIPSNIAEGAARNTPRELAQYLYTARGSLSELDTQLEIACRLGYLSSDRRESLARQVGRVGRLIGGMIRHARASVPNDRVREATMDWLALHSTVANRADTVAQLADREEEEP